MTFLIPLLGLRVQHHSGTISVFLRIMMAIFIRNLRIIRTYRLILKPNMFPSEISTEDMGFLNLLKKFLGFFGPSCSPGKLKSFGREQDKIFH